MGKYLDLDDVAAGHPVAEKELRALRDENSYLTSKVAQNALDRMMTVDPDEDRQKLVAQIHRYYAEIQRLREALEEILCRVEAHARFHEETWDGDVFEMCKQCRKALSHEDAE